MPVILCLTVLWDPLNQSFWVQRDFAGHVAWFSHFTDEKTEVWGFNWPRRHSYSVTKVFSDGNQISWNNFPQVSALITFVFYLWKFKAFSFSTGPIAQGLEHWSCKSGVMSSYLAGPDEQFSYSLGFLVAQMVKKSVCNAGDLGSVPAQEDPLEESMATHSSILAWRIPMDREAWWAISYMGLQRVRHDWATKHFQYKDQMLPFLWADNMVQTSLWARMICNATYQLSLQGEWKAFLSQMKRSSSIRRKDLG